MIFFQHLISGTAAGFASTVALYPLEVVKTRMQVIENRQGAYGSLRSSLVTIFRMEGVRGLYRGLLPAVIASSGSWGGYFFLYEYFKQINQTYYGSKQPAYSHVSAYDYEIYL